MLNDNQTYGLGVAKAFADRGEEGRHRDRRRTVLGRQAAQLHRAVPGGQGLRSRLVYLGGIYDNNGGQLIKDKVAVLGDNTASQADRARRLHRLPGHAEAARVRGHVPDLRRPHPGPALKAGGAGAKLLDAYKAKYGKDPEGSYPLYGVAAVQVILAAIAKSDGTRKGVTDAVFSGDGHHDPGGRVGHRQGDQDRPGHRVTPPPRTSRSRSSRTARKPSSEVPGGRVTTRRRAR